MLAVSHPLADALLVAVVTGAVLGIPTVVLALISHRKVNEVRRQTTPSDGVTLAHTVEQVQRQVGEVRREQGEIRREQSSLATAIGEHLANHENRAGGRRRWDTP